MRLRYAQMDSLLYPLQELQDRISLEVPAAFIKEESIRESTDQSVAKYTVAYYHRADNKPDGDEMDVASIVHRLVSDVLDNYAVVYDIVDATRSRNTFITTVTTHWDDEATTASFHGAAASEFAALPITVYVGSDVYNLASDGEKFFVLKNGEKLGDGSPSPAYALGSMLGVLQEVLPDVEAAEDLPGSPPTDFLAGLAMNIVATPDLSDEAKEHFVRFYELVTLNDFEAQGGGDE